MKQKITQMTQKTPTPTQKTPTPNTQKHLFEPQIEKEAQIIKNLFFTKKVYPSVCVKTLFYVR